MFYGLGLGTYVLGLEGPGLGLQSCTGITFKRKRKIIKLITVVITK